MIRKKVLIVDDNADLRKMMAVIVEMKGYTAVLSHDGEHAIEQAEKECPDLILMDVGLPQIDGLEATRLIKATKNCKDTPVIAVTAYRGLRERAIAAGCADLIEKPIDFAALNDLLEVHLN